MASIQCLQQGVLDRNSLIHRKTHKDHSEHSEEKIRQWMSTTIQDHSSSYCHDGQPRQSQRS